MEKQKEVTETPIPELVPLGAKHPNVVTLQQMGMIKLTRTGKRLLTAKGLQVLVGLLGPKNS